MAIEIFGVERCMFASNFPVDGLRIGYGEMYAAFKPACPTSQSS